MNTTINVLQGSGHLNSAGKRQGQITCYRLALQTWRTKVHERFTILEVAADSHELMIPAAHYTAIHASEQLDRGAACRRITTTHSTTLGFHHADRKLLLVYRPAEGRRLSWPEHTVADRDRPECYESDNIDH